MNQSREFRGAVLGYALDTNRSSLLKAAEGILAPTVENIVQYYMMASAEEEDLAMLPFRNWCIEWIAGIFLLVSRTAQFAALDASHQKLLIDRCQAAMQEAGELRSSKPEEEDFLLDHPWQEDSGSGVPGDFDDEGSGEGEEPEDEDEEG